jgi:hypothetical protein
VYLEYPDQFLQRPAALSPFAKPARRYEPKCVSIFLCWRLFSEDVLAGLDCPHRNVEMGGWDGQINHDIDVRSADQVIDFHDL